jgi:hypothetical protein
MSFETKNSSNLNSDDAQQICPQLLEEIANDDELKTLTEEEIKAVFGGLRILVKPLPTYGGPRCRKPCGKLLELLENV